MSAATEPPAALAVITKPTNEASSTSSFTAKMLDEGSQKYTVDEALASLGFGRFQAFVLAYAGMGWVSEAMEMMLLSFVGPSVQLEWGLSSHEESLITSIVFVGMLLGAYSWGVISDIYGRRKLHFVELYLGLFTRQSLSGLVLRLFSHAWKEIVLSRGVPLKGFLFTAIFTSGAGLLSAFAPNYFLLILLRFLVGIGLGGGPVLSSWFLEFIPAPTRGTWMCVFSGFWTFGTILEASIAWLVVPTLGWRWLLTLSALPSFLLLLFYGVVPESPRYLCMKGRTLEALHVMKQIARENRTTLPSGMLVSDHKIEREEDPNASEDAHLISISKDEFSVERTMKPKTGGIGAVSMLLSQKLVKSTLLLWVVFFGNAFSYYGIVLLTSELSNENKQCRSAKAFHSINSKDVSLYKDVFITSLAEVPGLILSAVVVDKLGRKLSMSAMFFLSCIFLFPLIFHQSELVTTALLFGARICITGSFTIVYIYAPEIYPTSVRTTGVGIASSVGRLGGITCPLVAVGLVAGCHQTLAILLFESVVLLSAIAVLLFPRETKGRELDDSVH